MIPLAGDGRIRLAGGAMEMRSGMNSLALKVYEALSCDRDGAKSFIFRGPRGNSLAILWHDGLGMSLYAKRLD